VRLSILGPAYPLRGGIAHHVYAVHKTLVSRGHELQVISFRRLYPALLFPGKTTFDTSGLALDSGAEALLDPVNPVTWRRAKSRIGGFAPDAVLFQWWNPFFSPVTGSISRFLSRRGIRGIAECHNVLPHERSAVDRLLVHYAFGRIDRFITHSTADRDQLLELKPAARVLVAPLPELSEFRGRQTRDKSGRTILFFGLVRKYKGLDVLLEAMPRVLERIECRLIIAGEFYDPVERYRQTTRRLGIERAVQIEDRYLSNEEVPDYFDRADVLVMPYLSSTQSGIARISLSNHLPIIATGVGGLAEVVREGYSGLLVPPGDPAALGDALIKYFDEGLGPIFERNLATSHDNQGSSLADAIECLATAS
jgi:glycosyltransferase involved in cell wall biosynthesis